MRHALALLGVLALAPEGLAQVPLVIGGGGIGVVVPQRRIIVGGFAPGIFAPNPIVGGLGPRVSSLTIYSPQSSSGGNAPVVVSPNITINVNVPTGPADIRDEDFPDKIIIRPGQRPAARPAPAVRAPAPVEAPEKPLPGDQAGGFRPVRPEDRDRAQRPMPAEQADAPAVDPFRRPDRPIPRAPNPAAPENEQLLALGRMSFADGEYVRAERRFAQAVQAAPKDPGGHFFLAQAQFAVGKYREAVASICAGLRLRPDWPNSRFRVRELYGQNPDDFMEQLQQLQVALARHKDDPALLFLYAYQLWFDGRQDDARPYLQRALPLVTEPRFVLFFLQAQQAGAVALKR
jgi:hypothetical protein